MLSRTRRRREQRRSALACLRSSGAEHGDGVVDGGKRGKQAMAAAEGVDGAWFQSQSVAGAAATRGDGCGQRMAPNGGASNDVTGRAAVDALGDAARGEVNAMAGTAPPPPCAAAACAL